MNIAYKIQGQCCHDSVRNIGTVKKRMNQKVRISPNFGTMFMYK